MVGRVVGYAVCGDVGVAVVWCSLVLLDYVLSVGLVHVLLAVVVLPVFGVAGVTNVGVVVSATSVDFAVVVFLLLLLLIWDVWRCWSCSWWRRMYCWHCCCV